jgi:hypothetical protein
MRECKHEKYRDSQFKLLVDSAVPLQATLGSAHIMYAVIQRARKPGGKSRNRNPRGSNAEHYGDTEFR